MLLQSRLKGELLDALSCMGLCTAASQTQPQNQRLQIPLVSVGKEQFSCTAVSSPTSHYFPVLNGKGLCLNTEIKPIVNTTEGHKSLRKTPKHSYLYEILSSTSPTTHMSFALTVSPFPILKHCSFHLRDLALPCPALDVLCTLITQETGKPKMFVNTTTTPQSTPRQGCCLSLRNSEDFRDKSLTLQSFYFSPSRFIFLTPWYGESVFKTF